MSAQMEVSGFVSEAAELEADLSRVGSMLATSADTPDSVVEDVKRWIQLIDRQSMAPPADVDPYFLIALESAALHAQGALMREDPERRNALRLSVEQWRQVFRDIAEHAPVDETRPIEEVARWVLATLNVPVGELAALVGVSPRTYQRWITGESSPRPEEERRLRLIAHVASNLRHAMTGPGVMQWFRQPRKDLKERLPSDLLDVASEAPRLLMLASSARSMRAT